MQSNDRLKTKNYYCHAIIGLAITQGKTKKVKKIPSVKFFLVDAPRNQISGASKMCRWTKWNRVMSKNIVVVSNS